MKRALVLLVGLSLAGCSLAPRYQQPQLPTPASWPAGDWRNLYFTPDNLAETLARVERLRPLVPDGMDLPELALRFILEHKAVATTIPGMRRPRHVERNLAASDGERLPPRLGR